MAPSVSSISQAFADGAASIHIPKPAGIADAPDKDNAAVLAAYRHSATGLPTPPNSISPNLPAHSLAARARKEVVGSPPSQVDSDVELGDAMDSAKPSGLPTNSSDSGHGAITPALIARDYLPGIILGKGQVPVKDVINHLCKTLPGFADIPPAKARRIVGAALEGHVGGPEGNVEFEKTGWGRWNAKIRTQPLHTINENRSSTGVGVPSSAMKIPGSSAAQHKPRRISNGSWAADSSLSSHSEHGDQDVFHQEVDAMSIDEDADHGTRYPRPHSYNRNVDPNFYSDTDEEDWASMGTAALRAGSYGSGGRLHKHHKLHKGLRTKSPAPGGLSRSVPVQYRSHQNKRQQSQVPMNLDFTGIDANTQEREAIEALLRMGTM